MANQHRGRPLREALGFMINVSARAAQHIQRSISREVNRLLEIERRAENDRPTDFDAHDRAVLEDMVSEFDGPRDMNPSSASFQFASITLVAADLTAAFPPAASGCVGCVICRNGT